jgi:tripartite-type tricarboxylate transporter receptor subunit TctC
MNYLTHIAAVAVTLVALGQHDLFAAQDYPTRNITLVVPWPPGGTVDTVTRIIAPRLSDRLGKTVVVENHPGAGSTLGTAVLTKAAPDGYTLGMPGSASMAIGPAMYKSLAYEPTRDFAPIALIGRSPFVLIVHPSLPVTTVLELIAYGKIRKLNYASGGGAGSPGHLYAEIFKTMTGTEMIHIPYKGSTDAIKDVAAGHVSLMFSDLTPVLSLIRANSVRALAVTTLARWSVAPEIPPLNDAGVPGFDAAGWFMMAGPAGTPAVIAARLHSELKTIMGSAGIKEMADKIGVVPVVSPPLAELHAFIVSEKMRWGKVVQQAGLAGSQ